MSTVLKLPARLSSVNCDVRDLAPLLPPVAERLRWCLADGYEVAEPVMKAEAWELGVGTFPFESLSFAELCLWWSRLLQTFWGTYVAVQSDEELDRFPRNYLDRIEPEVLTRCPYALQACDVSYWLVHSTDAGFLKAIEDAFPEAVRVPYEQGDPSRAPWARDHSQWKP